MQTSKPESLVDNCDVANQAELAVGKMVKLDGNFNRIWEFLTE